MKIKVSIGYRSAMLWDLDKIDNTTLGHWVRSTLEMSVADEDSVGDDVRLEPVDPSPQKEIDA